MGFVHRHKGRGAVLALIALALQILLSFGHVHVRGLGGSQAGLASQASLVHTPAGSPAQTPNDDDYCAICASIFLASSAFAPAPPQLLVPAAFQTVEHYFDAGRPVVEPPRLAFRSRAPPVA